MARWHLAHLAARRPRPCYGRMVGPATDARRQPGVRPSTVQTWKRKDTGLTCLDRHHIPQRNPQLEDLLVCGYALRAARGAPGTGLLKGAPRLGGAGLRGVPLQQGQLLVAVLGRGVGSGAQLPEDRVDGPAELGRTQTGGLRRAVLGHVLGVSAWGRRSPTRQRRSTASSTAKACTPTGTGQMLRPPSRARGTNPNRRCSRMRNSYWLVTPIL